MKKKKERFIDIVLNNAIELDSDKFEELENNHVSVLLRDELLEPISYHIEKKYGFGKWERKKKRDFLKDYGAKKSDISRNIYKRMLKGNEIIVYKNDDLYDETLYAIVFNETSIY